jgi:hypothetical protein
MLSFCQPASAIYTGTPTEAHSGKSCPVNAVAHRQRGGQAENGRFDTPPNKNPADLAVLTGLSNRLQATPGSRLSWQSDIVAPACLSLDEFIHGSERAADDAVTADLGGVLRRDGDGDGFFVDVLAEVMHDFVHGCLVSLSVINDPASCGVV